MTSYTQADPFPRAFVPIPRARLERARVQYSCGEALHGYMHGYITTTNSYCGSLSPAMVAVVSGVEEFTPEPEPASRMFAIYPNPTSGTFTLMDKGEAQPERVHVEIFDMQGGRIMSTSYTGEKNHHFTLNGLPSGLYFLKVIAGDQAESFKLIITR